MIPGGPRFVALDYSGETVASDDDLDALLWELLSAMVKKHGSEELCVWEQGNPCDRVVAVLRANGQVIRLDGDQPRVQQPPRRNGRQHAQNGAGRAQKT